MKFEINETTNNQEASFGAKLLSMSQKPLENANGTIYRIANIEFEDINGNTQKSSAMVYEGNYNYGMEIGKKKYEETNDLKTAILAIKSYREATRTAVAQVQYKKLTGTPKGIAFLEE